MTRDEIVVVVTLAGPEAERRLPFAERRTRRGVAVHEAAHCIAALRFGVPVFRVVVEDDRGVTQYVENAGSGKPLEDNERARGIAMVTLPDAEPREIAIWLFETRRRAFGVVEKHWGRILGLADVLDARGELCREEVLAAVRQSWKVPSGPSSPPSAAAVSIARCG
jgi:hypothetical protein